MNKSIFFRLDWFSLFLYLILMSCGLVNIYSSTYNEIPISFLDLSSPFVKQLWVFLVCFLTFPFWISIKPSFFEHTAYLFYVLSLLSLIGLFFFGQTISGATSWYFIGGFGLQPSEFVKITTALVVASNLSAVQNDIRQKKSLFKIGFLISFPILLILFQPDAGSALVFLGLFFVLIREGLDIRLLYFGIGSIFLFIVTLLYGTLIVSLGSTAVLFLTFFLLKIKYPKIQKTPFLFLLGACVIFTHSVHFIFNSVFEQRHRDRFNIILGLESDSQGIGYNINQSKIAIGSGGFSGKGFLNGTQTKGDFVPEQHTDYIFSTLGEEWGFLGSSLLIISFAALIVRILYRSERQILKFPRVYSHAFASILFVHFFVNIGMTLGLVPTVGIPLPYISFGGSCLMAFSFMFFIYLNFDANRLS